MTLTIDMIQLNLTYCLDLETINNKRQVGTERSTLSADWTWSTYYNWYASVVKKRDGERRQCLLPILCEYPPVSYIKEPFSLEAALRWRTWNKVFYIFIRLHKVLKSLVASHFHQRTICSLHPPVTTHLAMMI
jgi:hypothetical protein